MRDGFGEACGLGLSHAHARKGCFVENIVQVKRAVERTYTCLGLQCWSPSTLILLVCPLF